MLYTTNYGSLSSLIFPGIPTQWWQRSQVWNTLWPVPSQAGKIPAAFPSRVTQTAVLTLGTGEGDTAPAWSIQSAKNPLNSTSASLSSVRAQAPTSCRSRAVKIPQNPKDPCEWQAEFPMHKSQGWSKGCVYPRSKDCLSSQHSGLLQPQHLHNIKPLTAESFLTPARPGIGFSWIPGSFIPGEKRSS